MKKMLAGVMTGLALMALFASPVLAQDRDCRDFASQAAAQAYFRANGGSPTNNVDRLDANHNGVACEGYAYRNSTRDLRPTGVAANGGGGMPNSSTLDESNAAGTGSGSTAALVVTVLLSLGVAGRLLRGRLATVKATTRR